MLMTFPSLDLSAPIAHARKGQPLGLENLC